MAQGSPVENWMQAVPMLISGDSYCSGVLINSRQIATAYHCIASGKEAYVEWEDGTAQRAQVVSVDRLQLHRIALLDQRLRSSGAGPKQRRFRLFVAKKSPQWLGYIEW